MGVHKEFEKENFKNIDRGHLKNEGYLITMIEKFPKARVLCNNLV